MATGVVKRHRVLKTTPEKLYKAFLDPEAMVKWLPPHGFTGKVHEMDAKLGRYRLTIRRASSMLGVTFSELIK